MLDIILNIVFIIGWVLFMIACMNDIICKRKIARKTSEIAELEVKLAKKEETFLDSLDKGE